MEDENVYISIKNRKEEERPREKLLAKGAGLLTNAELLAILIGSGTRNYSAIDVAQTILKRSHENLHELGRQSIHELRQTRGIGLARAITITAALELGRRRQIADGLERTRVASSKDAAEIVIPLLSDLSNEAFCVLYLNQANKLLRHEIISNGGLAATVTDIRLILKQALILHATRIIVAHNHPSGNLHPSGSDKKLTNKLREACKVMDIELLDHLIVAGNKILSMANEGLI